MVLRKIENKSFIRSSEGAISSYNWTDLLSGKGMLTLYGADSIKGDYYLASYTTYPTIGYKAGTSNFEFYFETEITKNIVFEGNAIVEIPIYELGGSARTYTLEVEINKYNGVAETTLGSSSHYHELLQTGTWKMNTFIIAISKTTFKVGDILRLNINCIKGASTGSNRETRILCNPMNEGTDATIKSTRLKINMPVVIDL